MASTTYTSTYTSPEITATGWLKEFMRDTFGIGRTEDQAESARAVTQADSSAGQIEHGPATTSSDPRSLLPNRERILETAREAMRGNSLYELAMGRRRPPDLDDTYIRGYRSSPPDLDDTWLRGSRRSISNDPFQNSPWSFEEDPYGFGGLSRTRPYMEEERLDEALRNMGMDILKPSDGRFADRVSRHMKEREGYINRRAIVNALADKDLLFVLFSDGGMCMVKDCSRELYWLRQMRSHMRPLTWL